MKHLLYITLFTIGLISCQIEDDNAPAPDDSFIKYFGELTGYEAKDIELLNDGSGFVVLCDVIGDDGSKDYGLFIIDLEGNLVNQTTFGFDVPTNTDLNKDGIIGNDVISGEDLGAQVEVTANGTFWVVGTTVVNDNASNILNVSVGTISVFDEDLNFLSDGTQEFGASIELTDGLDLVGADLIIADNGDLIFFGSIEIERGNGDVDFDYFVIRAGSMNFQEFIGVPGDGQDDMVVRGFEKDNGNLVLIGYSSDPSSLGENGGNNGTNVLFTELTPEGKILNSVSYGIDGGLALVYNEVVNNAIQTPSGFAIVGTSTLSTEETYAFYMNLTRTGGLVSANLITSEYTFSGTDEPLETEGFGIVQSLDNDYILLGNYQNFVTDILGQTKNRAVEGLYKKIDQFGNGIPGFETNFGLADGNDRVVDAVRLPDGKIVALANVDFGGGIELIALMKLNDTGNLVD